MARLIVKSPYVTGGSGGGGGAGGYLKYIGTREGVELLPSGYMEYMAERPQSHGLFGDEDVVDMNAAMKELNEYPGNIWTHVISLKREDAERLGYDRAAQWRNLIRTHRNEIASAMNIPPSDFRWYAAFHDEGGHPHIHMMAWSAKPRQAYLSKDGIRKIKSALTNDIFKQELLHTYEQKSSSREELVRRAREEMKSLAQEMQTSLGSHPEVESLMITLAAQLETVKGKKTYGYLPKTVKKTVDEVVNLMEQAYLDAANVRDVFPMFYLELVSGLRKGELVALLWSDLDAEHKTISISKQYIRNPSGEVMLSRPKTETSVRQISIPQTAVDLLIQEHDKHPGNPYMFPSPVTGEMYHPDSVVKLHEKILKDAGLEHIRFHDLRHTFATLALQNGVDVKTVSSMLGHYDAGFTLRTYTHATRQMQNQAAKTMGNFMAKVM